MTTKVTNIYNLKLTPSQFGQSSLVVNCSQYDSLFRVIQFNLYNGNAVYSIPEGSVVTIRGTKKDNTGFEYECGYSNNVVTFPLQQQITIFPGKVPAELRITNNGEIIGSWNFLFLVEESPLSDDTTISETQLPLLEQAIEAAGRLNEAFDDITEFTDETYPNAVQSIQDEGATQVANVTNEGTTQRGLVSSEGTTQIANVQAEGTTQVGNVQAKGTEVLDSIPSDYTTLSGEVADLQNAIRGWQIGITADQYAMRIHQDVYWNGTDARFGVSAPIELPLSKAFTKLVVKIESITNYVCYVAFSKENVAGSSTLFGGLTPSTVTAVGIYEVPIPDGAKYVWLSTKAMNNTCVTQAYLLADDLLANTDNAIKYFVDPISDTTDNIINFDEIGSYGGSTSASWEVVGENKLRVYRSTASTNSAIVFKHNGLVEGQTYYLHLNIESLTGANPKMRFGLYNANGSVYATTDDAPSTGEYSGYAVAPSGCLGAILFITAGTSTVADYVISEIMCTPVPNNITPVGYVPQVTASDYEARVNVFAEAKAYADKRSNPVRDTHSIHKPRVTFIDDDGLVEFYQYILPIAEEYNIPYVIAYAADISPDMRTTNFMTQAQCQEAIDKGCEVVVHGNYNLTTFSLAEAEANVLKSKRALASKGFPSELYVYPHSGTNEEIRAMMCKHFDGAFITGSPQSPNWRTNASNDDLLGNYFIHRVSAGGYYDTPVSTGRYAQYSDTSSMAYFGALIDECIANNSWLVFMTHSAMMVEGQHSSSGWLPTPNIDHFQRLKDIIEYIQAKQADGAEIEIVTASEGFEMFRNAIQAGDYLGSEYNTNMNLHDNKGVAISKKGITDFGN